MGKLILKIANNIILILTIILFILVGYIFYKVKSTEKEIADNFSGENWENQDSETDVAKFSLDNPLELFSPEEVETPNYTTYNSEGFFYSQLEQPAKTIYNALEQNREQMKTGTHRIEFGNIFKDILDEEGGSDKLGEYYQSAIESYIYDNPSVFYLNLNNMYLQMETTTKITGKTYNVYITSGDNENYLSDEFKTQENIERAESEIEDVKYQILAQKTGDTYKDIKMVHDYLVSTVEYDQTLSKPYIHNLYSAIITKESVCEGYAESFKYFMDALEIPCIIVTGIAQNSLGEQESHAWNYVQIDGIWYAIDVTWDDPISESGYVSQESKYRYFLKGSDTMSQDHFPDGQFTDNGRTYVYENLSKSDYII